MGGEREGRSRGSSTGMWPEEYRGSSRHSERKVAGGVGVVVGIVTGKWP